MIILMSGLTRGLGKHKQMTQCISNKYILYISDYDWKCHIHNPCSISLEISKKWTHYRFVLHVNYKPYSYYAQTPFTPVTRTYEPCGCLLCVCLCAACLNLVESANLVWRVLWAFLGTCSAVSQTNLSFQAGFVCCQQWDRGRAQLWSWRHQGTRPSVPHTQLWDK